MNTHPERSDNEFDDELIEAWLMAMEGSVDEARREEFNRLIVERPHLRERIIRLTQEQAWLMWHGTADDEAGGDGAHRHIASPRMAALAEGVDTGEPRLAEPTVPSPPAPHALPASATELHTSMNQDSASFFGFTSRTIPALGVGVFTALAALLFVLQPWSAPVERDVASTGVGIEDNAATVAVGAWVARLIRATPDATWAESSGPNEFLLRLRAGQTMELLSGLAEVEFVSGAVVILHGPSRFTATGADSATLERGRVTGRAENGNFRLLTPSAQVVDLGTEFGVAVDDEASTNVVVFEGEVSVAPNESKKRRVESIYLDNGATARIDANGELATGVSVEWKAFKRAIPDEPSRTDELLNENRLSVIDIVNGGDGRGRALAGAIDPLTGAWDQRPWQHEHGPGRLRGDARYHRSASHPMIDGVFIPSHRGKNTQITSSGQCIDFPKNLGATWGPIWARRRSDGALPSATGDFWGTGTLPFIIRRIEAARIGALGMHSNVGLTLDLRNCSEPYRGRFRSFEATLVNLDLAVDTDPDGLRRAPIRTADFWVFVDGELKYSRRDFGRDLEGESFTVELASNDRFLTLVSTDGGNSISFDHVVLIDPVLMLREAGPRAHGENGTEN